MVHDELKDLEQDGSRILIMTKHFVLFLPFASAGNFEMWLAPRRHTSSFLDTSDDELKDLARVLEAGLSALFHECDGPSFNYALHSEPIRPPHSMIGSINASFHWYLEIIPRTHHQLSGFWFGTNISFSNATPESCAKKLRKQIAKRHPELCYRCARDEPFLAPIVGPLFAKFKPVMKQK
jgi:UDPglucose--hexose-1-phosphate uridylyltransferase